MTLLEKLASRGAALAVSAGIIGILSGCSSEQGNEFTRRLFNAPGLILSGTDNTIVPENRYAVHVIKKAPSVDTPSTSAQAEEIQRSASEERYDEEGVHGNGFYQVEDDEGNIKFRLGVYTKRDPSLEGYDFESKLIEGEKIGIVYSNLEATKRIPDAVEVIRNDKEVVYSDVIPKGKTSRELVHEFPDGLKKGRYVLRFRNSEIPKIDVNFRVRKEQKE